MHILAPGDLRCHTFTATGGIACYMLGSTLLNISILGGAWYERLCLSGLNVQADLGGAQA